MKYITLFIILLFLTPGNAISWQAQTRCPDIQERGFFNILSVNLLYSENKDRLNRFQILVDFIQQQATQDEPVDIILLQEIVGGILSGTQNSSKDLKKMLAERGLFYNLRYCPVNNQIGVLAEGIAMLSRCRFLFTAVRTLPTVYETPNEGFDIPLKRRAMMGRIHIPGVGKINIFNTHLCAFCKSTDRVSQSEALVKFVSDVKRLIFWNNSPIIIGGDFNMDVATSEGRKVYDTIMDSGFEDTYATANSCVSCCSAEEGYEGCTYSVPENPYGDEIPARIDYIFAKDLQVLESTVVFGKPPNWVSDHSGVLSKIALP
jgi:maltose 6'-phosphate phosphatase